jgi:GNAT superfamily N-acetyltransferase
LLVEMTEWDDDYAILESSLSRERLVSKLENTRANGNSWFIWEDGGEYLAWAIIHWSGKKTEPDYPDMMKLFVREDRRRRGIASKIISACEQIALARGCDRIGLSVAHIGNEAAKALYKGLGYEFTPQEPYALGKSAELVLDMVKRLKAED